MKPKTIVLMVIAIVCGLGASYLTSRVLAEREEQQPAAPPVEKVNVLVAKQVINAQTKLVKPEEFFTEKSYAKEDAPPGAITDLKQLKNKYVKSGLRQNDHVSEADLTETQSSLPVPDGMVGIGVRVSIENIASGFACTPGSRVDVVWMVRRGGDESTYTTILLHNVLVLAADTESNQTQGARPASVVTVALGREDALKLQLAVSQGPISLFLRKLGDDTPESDVRMTLKKLLDDRSSGPKAVQGEPSPEPKPLVQEPKVAEGPKPNPQDSKKVRIPGEKEEYWYWYQQVRGDKTWWEKVKVDAQGRPIPETAPRAAINPQPQVEENPEPTPAIPAPKPGRPNGPDNNKKKIDI